MEQNKNKNTEQPLSTADRQMCYRIKVIGVAMALLAAYFAGVLIYKHTTRIPNKPDQHQRG